MSEDQLYQNIESKVSGKDTIESDAFEQYKEAILNLRVNFNTFNRD